MANSKETITRDIILNIKTRVGEAEKSAEKIKRTLAEINVSDSFKKSMTAPLAEALKDMDKLKGKLNTTMSPVQLEKWNQQWGDISHKLNEIVQTVSSKKLSPKDLIFDANTQKRMDDIEKSLKRIETTKAKLVNQKSKNEAIVAGMSQDNQLKTEQSLGLNKAQMKSIVDLVSKNIGNEQYISRIIAERAPKYQEILAAQSKITQLAKEQADYEAMRGALNKPGKMTNAMKSQMLASEAIDTTGLSSSSNKDQFRQAFENTGIRDFTSELATANAAVTRLQNSITGSQRQAYSDWSQDLVRSAQEVAQGLDADGRQAETLNSEMAQLRAQGLTQARAGLDSIRTGAQQCAPALEAVGEEAHLGAQQLEELNAQDRFFKDMQFKIAQIFGLANAFIILRQFINASKQTIKELDAAFTEIAVVTEKTTTQLWESFSEYNEMAQELGTTTKDAVKTSALYYQQGLNTVEVMDLTVQTIKMARIANMEYSAATEAMTSAVRGFKMEMSDAQVVVDVYSALAAKSAVDTQQLAVAISKVASIAQSAGMTLQTTSAFLSQIIETTQEAPETAGTALKTIIARFTEMNKNVSAFRDENGDIVDVNKTEEALKTVGVALRDSITGQIRDVDDVFLELASKWETLDRNAQRYVATVASGARQQSRFIAMMDNYKRTMELVNIATDASGASTTQFNKTLDSVDSKLNQLKANFETIINNIISNEFARGFLDALNNIMKVLANIATMGPAVFVPVIIGLFSTIKNLASTSAKLIEGIFRTVPENIDSATTTATQNTTNRIRTWIENMRSMLARANWTVNIDVNTVQDGEPTGDIDGNPQLTIAQNDTRVGRAITSMTQWANKYSMGIIAATALITTTLAASGQEVLATGAVAGQGVGATIGSIFWGPIGGAIGGALGAIGGMLIAQIDEWTKYGFENTKAKIKAAKKIADELAQTQSEYLAANGTLTDSASEYKTMTEKLNQGLSLTAEETLNLASTQDELGRTYPELISGRDAETGLLKISSDKLRELIKAREAEAEIISAQAAAAQYIVDQKERENKNADTSRNLDNKVRQGNLIDRKHDKPGKVLNVGFGPAGFGKINEEIVNSLKRGDENSAKEIDDQLAKLKNDIKTNDKSWSQYSVQVDRYINSVYSAVGDIQSNLKAQQDQLRGMADFDANILKRFGSKMVAGEDIANMSEAMTNDYSIYLAQGLAKAIDSGDVKANAAAEASDSIATWLKNQMDPTDVIANAYEEIATGNEYTKADYDAYSALLPYFKGVEGGTTQAFKDLGLSIEGTATTSLEVALRAASENILASTLPEDAQKAIRAVIKTGDLKGASDLANSLSDFNINTSSLTSLEGIKTALSGFEQNADVKTFLDTLTEKIKTLGYTSEEASSKMTNLISKLTKTNEYEAKSAEGKLTKEDIEELIFQNSKFGVSTANFAYDPFGGGYTAKNMPWDLMRTADASKSVTEAETTIAKNKESIALAMGSVIGKNFEGDFNAAITELQKMIADEITTNLQNGDFIKERGFNKTQTDAYTKSKTEYDAIQFAQMNIKAGQDIMDLKGIQSYESEMEAAVATSRKFAKVLEEQEVTASSLSSEYRITESQIAAIEKAYPQLKGRMDDVNTSAKDYFEIMNEVAELETTKQLEETGKNLGNYLASVEGMGKSTSEFKTGMQSISEVLGQGLMVNGQLAIDSQFAAENLGLIRQACEDDYNAFTKLQQKLAQEILIKAGSSVDFSALMKGLVSVRTLGQEATDALVAAGMFEIETTTINVPDMAASAMDLANSFLPGNLAPKMRTKPIEIQILKPSNKPMYTAAKVGSNYSTPKAKGGGGGKKETYDATTDKYYNEIKAIEKLNDTLADLKEAREDSKLSPDEYQKNVMDTVKYNRQLQATLHDYNNKLRNDRLYAANQINKMGAPGAAVVHNGKLMANKDGIKSLGLEAQKEIEILIKQIDDLDKAIESNSDQYMELEKGLKELALAYQQSYSDVEQKILDILMEQDRKEIELTQKKYDKIKEADEEYLDALKKNIDDRRRVRDKENDYKELSKKEKRLALLKRDTSGIYASEILALEQELTKTRQDMADKETDDMISKLEEESDNRSKAQDKEMKELEEFQKDKEESMTAYNEKAQNIMQLGATELQKWLQTYDKEYLTATENAQKQYLETWQKTLNEAKIFKDNVTSDGAIVDAKTKAEQMASEARAVLNKVDANGKSYSAGAKDISSYNADGALAWYNQYIANRTDLPPEIMAAFKKLVVAKHQWEGKTPKFANGGLVDFTGPAWVDGTKSQPEAFLSADETKNFKMLSQLLQQSLSFSGLKNTQVGTGGGEVHVDQLTIEVASIGNDYDVDRMIARVKGDILGATGDRNINVINRRR